MFRANWNAQSVVRSEIGTKNWKLPRVRMLFPSGSHPLTTSFNRAWWSFHSVNVSELITSMCGCGDTAFEVVSPGCIEFSCKIDGTESSAPSMVPLTNGAGPGVGSGSSHGSRTIARSIGIGRYSSGGLVERIES